MTQNSIDAYVAERFGDSAAYLMMDGCQDITRGQDNYNNEWVERGFKKVQLAVSQGKDLTPFLDLGYKNLCVLSSSPDRDWDRGLRILQQAQQWGAPIDHDRLRRIAYSSITNEGTQRLTKIEKFLNVSIDPAQVAQEAYRVLNTQDCPFYARALDALIYASEKGEKINLAKLPENEKLEQAVTDVLQHNPHEGLRYLKVLRVWGRSIASDKAISQLEMVVSIN